MNPIILETTTPECREIVKALLDIIHNLTTYGLPVETSHAHRVWSESIKETRKIIRLTPSPEAETSHQEEYVCTCAQHDPLARRMFPHFQTCPLFVNLQVPVCICGFDADGWRDYIAQQGAAGDTMVHPHSHYTYLFRTRRPKSDCPCCNVKKEEVSESEQFVKNIKAICTHRSVTVTEDGGRCNDCKSDVFYNAETRNWGDAPPSEKREPFSLDGEIEDIYHNHSQYSTVTAFRKIVTEINQLRQDHANGK